MLLRLIEIVVCFQSLKTVYQLFISVISHLELVQILMIVSNNFFYFFTISLMYFRNPTQKIHYNLDVLNLFPRLNLAIKSQTVLIRKNWFRIFRHHYHSYLVLYKLKVQFSCLQISEVLLVPPQLKKTSYQLKFKQKINTWVITTIYQTFHTTLNTFSSFSF